MSDTKGWRVVDRALDHEKGDGYHERGIWIPLGDKPAPGEMATFREDVGEVTSLTIDQGGGWWYSFWRDNGVGSGGIAPNDLTRYVPPETVEVPREDLRRIREELRPRVECVDPKDRDMRVENAFDIADRLYRAAALRAGEVKK